MVPFCRDPLDRERRGLLTARDQPAMHAVAIPYYTGLIRHRPNGALAAVHLADFRAAGLAEFSSA